LQAIMSRTAAPSFSSRIETKPIISRWHSVTAANQDSEAFASAWLFPSVKAEPARARSLADMSDDFGIVAMNRPPYVSL
jgi:hypothetical protein